MPALFQVREPALCVPEIAPQLSLVFIPLLALKRPAGFIDGQLGVASLIDAITNNGGKPVVLVQRKIERARLTAQLNAGNGKLSTQARQLLRFLRLFPEPVI